MAMASRPAVQQAARAGVQAATQAETQQACRDCGECPVCGQRGGRPVDEVPSFANETRRLNVNDMRHLGYQRAGHCGGSPMFRDGRQYITLDLLHHGRRSHLEVFDRRGRHVGERCPACGKDIPDSRDPDKDIRDCI